MDIQDSWVVPVVACLAAASILLGVTPLAVIRAVNTLFGLGVAYSIKTWFAALILVGTFGASVRVPAKSRG